MSAKNKKNTKIDNIMVQPDDSIKQKEPVDFIKQKEPVDSEKYKVTLKLINKILQNIGKEQVDKLEDFKEIDREDIIKENNKTSLTDMESELFPLFNKKKVGYYRKTDALVLNCLRGMMKELNYDFTKTKKDISETINGKSYKRTHYLYSII